jgi:anti-anti-sigma factor
MTIAELAGELDIASAPALREQLLSLLRPGSSRLVIDLSKVSLCDASGLAVLVGIGRRARLPGGFLRLAAVSPQADQVLHITGLHRQPGLRLRDIAARVGITERSTHRQMTGRAVRLTAGVSIWGGSLQRLGGPAPAVAIPYRTDHSRLGRVGQLGHDPEQLAVKVIGGVFAFMRDDRQ